MNNFPVQDLAYAFFLAFVLERLVEYLKAPIAKKFPNLDLWWLPYATLLAGVGIVLCTSVDVFSFIFNVPVASKIATGIIIGGGSNLMHSIFDAISAGKPTFTLLEGSTELKESQG